MASIVLAAALVAPLSMREMPRPSPAKANLTNRENRPRVGAAFARALGIVGWSIKEAAAVLDVEPAQVSRWIAGTENIQTDSVYGTRLHGPFAVEMARDAAGCVVETTVTFRAVSA
jgi:hypothetical protein